MKVEHTRERTCLDKLAQLSRNLLPTIFIQDLFQVQGQVIRQSLVGVLSSSVAG
jgi:hypothetical protein